MVERALFIEKLSCELAGAAVADSGHFLPSEVLLVLDEHGIDDPEERDLIRAGLRVICSVRSANEQCYGCDAQITWRGDNKDDPRFCERCGDQRCGDCKAPAICEPCQELIKEERERATESEE